MRGKRIEVIDLTLDSDDDDELTLHARPATSKSPSKQTSIALPKSVRRPDSSTSTVSQPVVPLPSTQNDCPSNTIRPNALAQNSLKNDVRPSSKDVHDRPHGQSYTLVYASGRSAQLGGFVSLPAEKRRKLSVPERLPLATSQHGTGPSPSINGSRRLNLTGAPDELQRQASVQSTIHQKNTQAAFTASVMKLPANGMPSAQYLNSALKTSVTKSPSRHAASHSRAPKLVSPEGRLSGSPSYEVEPKTAIAVSGVAPIDSKTQLNTRQAQEYLVEQDDGSSNSSLAYRTSPLERGSNFLAAKESSRNASFAEMRMAAPLHLASARKFLPAQEDHDSVISISDDSIVGKSTAPYTPKHNSLPLSSIRREVADGKVAASFSQYGTPATPHSSNSNLSVPVATHHNTFMAGGGRKRGLGAFSEQESHLLIFLKEVKQLPWKEITRQFQAHFPSRQYHTLQSQYSTKLNKRDRSRDPPTLNLPPSLTFEATIDWTAVHASNPPPKLDREIATLQQGDIIQDESSGTESRARRDRPKRAVAPKNYTWPKLNGHMQGVEGETEFDSSQYLDSIDTEVQSISEDSAEELRTIPEKAIPVHNNPLEIDQEKEDAGFMLTHREMPYLSHSERSMVRQPADQYSWNQLCSRDWQGTIIHVDFSPHEVELVEQAIGRIASTMKKPKGIRTGKQLKIALQCFSEPKLLQLTAEIVRRLHTRDKQSIRAFLQDCILGKARIGSPTIQRIAAARPNRDQNTDIRASIVSMLRQRELGLHSRRGWKASSQSLTYQLKNKLQDSLGPALTYTGASSDVHAVAWSSDGQYFAAGAICVDDPDSMQYNRANNLLYGDISGKALYELGEHSVSRAKTESGPNSTHAMYASQDPKLYKTVSSVAFSPNGRFMFSGGYDSHVCVWGTTTDGTQPELIVAMKHKAEIDMLAVNRSGLLATASRKGDNHAIKVIAIPEDDPSNFQKRNLGSRKAAEKPDYKILPTALQFSPRYENLLLAGFGANARDDGRDTNGDICIWDVNAAANYDQLYVYGSGKNVFDLAFHHRQPWFAVGCVASQNVNRGTKSVIRIYDENGVGSNNLMKYGMRMELECRALDMNDVVWCPGDDRLIAAGCTSGRAYVWDIRRPDHFLRELTHGRSTMPLDDFLDREMSDTGIRFLSWGDNATRLYTGSSDGVVKVWNVVRSEEETFVKDLITADSGIMAGAFSPDRSRLIVGEVNGSINILEVGRDDCDLKDAEKFKFCPYQEIPDEPQQPQTPQNTDSGVASAAELLQTGQMTAISMGSFPVRQAVQGPNYAGPFDYGVDAPALRKQALQFQYELAHNPGPQCGIPSCADPLIKITDEERGDSGRSADRIPDELRKHFLAFGSNAAAIPGKSRCTNCGRAARPSDSPSDSALCERCSFACFRCGAASALQSDTDTFTCTTCNRIWDIGALGYECVKESYSRIDTSDVPLLKRYGRQLLEEKMVAQEQGTNDSFGDEMNALTDYYFDLAIDRPASPPL